MTLKVDPMDLFHYLLAYVKNYCHSPISQIESLLSGIIEESDGFLIEFLVPELSCAHSTCTNISPTAESLVDRLLKACASQLQLSVPQLDNLFVDKGHQEDKQAEGKEDEVLQGFFEIMNLCGSFMSTVRDGTGYRFSGMSVSLSSPDGQLVGGSVVGELIASSTVQVILGSFLPSFPSELKPKKPKTQYVPAPFTNASALPPLMPPPSVTHNDQGMQ